MTTIVAIVSDIHANSTTAVCPPVVHLDDAGQYRASRPQRWLWARWVAFWQAVAERREGHRLIIVLNGELADINSHPTTQMISRNPADALRLSAEVLAPALALLGEDDRIYVTRGTEAHSGQSAHLDETVASDIGATGPDDDRASWWRLRLQVDGVRFDIAHHPPGGGGRLPWTAGNFANRLAAMGVFSAAQRRERPPDLYVRGHVHRPGDSYDAFATRALVLPSWQLTTSYGHRIGGDPLPVGGAIVTCDKGQYQVEKHFWDWPVERYEIA